MVVDCGAVAPTLIESELFGHVRGAFTGAVSDRNGAFLEADGGTIFLDEIGELPLDLQPKLLRVLEAGTVRRVGEDKHRRVDVRVVAATHRDLEKEIEADRFRRDLYYRLAVVLVHGAAAARPARRHSPARASTSCEQMGRGDFELPRALMARFAAYHWPGNVRELRNLVERALAGADVDPMPRSPSRARRCSRRTGLTDLPFKEAKERLVESLHQGVPGGAAQQVQREHLADGPRGGHRPQLRAPAGDEVRAARPTTNPSPDGRRWSAGPDEGTPPRLGGDPECQQSPPSQPPSRPPSSPASKPPSSPASKPPSKPPS